MNSLKKHLLSILRLAIVMGALILPACTGVPVDLMAASGSQDSPVGSFQLQLGEVMVSGNITSISGSEIAIDDLVFRVDNNTTLPGNLKVGNLVKVHGLLLPDNTHYALAVTAGGKGSSNSESKGSEFEFYGVVQAIDADTWLISDQLFQIAAGAEIASGLLTGDVVKVEGSIANGQLVVREIKRVEGTMAVTVRSSDDDKKSTEMADDNQDEVEFFGAIESINGNTWVIGGKAVTIVPGTEIKGNLKVGDSVKVHLIQQAEGSFVAREVESEAHAGGQDNKSGDDSMSNSNEKEVYGLINSINGNTWVIGGQAVTVVAGSEIKGALKAGDAVKVHLIQQPDGSFVVREIEKAEKNIKSSDDNNSSSGKGRDDSSRHDKSDDRKDDNSGKGSNDD